MTPRSRRWRRGTRAAPGAIREGNHLPWSGSVVDDSVRGFSARGSLGQYLVVLPAAHLVAVRMRAGDATDSRHEGERNTYPAFREDAASLDVDGGGRAPRRPALDRPAVAPRGRHRPRERCSGDRSRS